MRASSGIRTHDPSVWAGEDSLCFRMRGHCDRRQYQSINIYQSEMLCLCYESSHRYVFFVLQINIVLVRKSFTYMDVNGYIE
jgi:hypothetical protein